MSKTIFGVIAFSAGAVLGAAVMGFYFRTHAVQLVAEGAGEKIFGEGSTGAKIVSAAGNLLQGLS
jgi:hypothetical protein